MITIINGSIEAALNDDNIVIAHIVNSQGGWGAGVSGVITKMCINAERMYRGWFSTKKHVMDLYLPEFKLGNVQFVLGDDNRKIFYANMLAQNGYMSETNKHPLNLDALGKALIKLCEFAKSRGLIIHMPKIGSGLGGGNWDQVYELVDNITDSYGLKVVIYDYQQ